MSKKTSRTPTPPPPSLVEYWDTFEESIRSSAGRGMVGLSTGFDQLDALLSGLRGLTVLGGEPGIGKTVFALNVALHAAQSEAIPVVFCAFEMPRMEMYGRFVSILTGLAYSDVREGALLANPSDTSAAKEAIRAVSPRLALVSKGDGCRLTDVFEMAKKLKDNCGAKRALIVVDSLQKYCGTEARDAASDKQALDTTIGEISNACERFDLDALVISHIPKASKGRTGVFMFSGSAGIDFEADVTMALWTDDDDPDERDVELHVLKNRHGRTGEVDLVFRAPFLKFEERS